MNPIEPIRRPALDAVEPHRRVEERPHDEDPREQERRRRRERERREPQGEPPPDDGLPHLDVRI